MNSMMRSVIMACGMGVLVACVFGLRFAYSPRDFQEANRGAKLEQLRYATQSRAEDRWQMVREVIARQRTLAEAIEQFQELDREWPDYRGAASEAKAGKTQDEWTYQHIRAIVEDILHDRPEQAAAVLHRLEQEYEKLRIERQAVPPD